MQTAQHQHTPTPPELILPPEQQVPEARPAEFIAAQRWDMVQDMRKYPLRSFRQLFVVWLLTGLFGGHRYYLNQIGTGVLMTLTQGFLGVGWIIDGLRLRKLLDAYNSEQMFRRTHGQPPIELDFLPTLDPAALRKPLGWAATERIASFAPKSILPDAVVVFLFTTILAAICHNRETYEPIGALFALVVLLNLSNVLLYFEDYRLVREILQWDYKLRLFYQAYGVPTPLRVMLKPFSGIVRMFKRREGGEARLFMELGFVFTVFFTSIDILQGDYFKAFAADGPQGVLEFWLEQTVTQFFLVALGLAPIGATLMKYRLSPMKGAATSRLVLSLITLTALWRVFF